MRLRIGSHRPQLNVGEGAVIVRETRRNEVNTVLDIGPTVTVRIEGADAHCKRAPDHSALIGEDPGTQQYCEPQYTAQDFAGHSWTFSESVADVPPAEWGRAAEQL